MKNCDSCLFHGPTSKPLFRVTVGFFFHSVDIKLNKVTPSLFPPDDFMLILKK